MNYIYKNLGIAISIIGIFIVASLLNTGDESEKASAENIQIQIESAEHVLSEKQVKYKEKSLNQGNPKVTYISNDNIEPAQTIEEVIDFNQYQKDTVVATGYTAGYESTGKNPDHPQYGITFSGIQVKRDLYSTIAADLNVYPLGTILYIPDYGYGVVADKGSAITGNKIDLYYETVDAVFNEWGKREVEVYVIEKGDGQITEEALVELNENEALQVFRSQFMTEEH